MFCPSCRTEYRAGFTKCADCGVDLVPELPADEAGDGADVPRNAEGLELLWSGVSEALTDQIDDALEAAHISHKITDKEFGLLPNLAQSANFVWIESRDRASSRSILAKILADSGTMEQEAELTASDEGRVNPFGLGRTTYKRSTDADKVPADSVELAESDAPSEPIPDDIVGDFDPEDATAEVWSGDDGQTADYLKMSLSGVGVGCVLKEDRGKVRVSVLPEYEKRAREIVREVVEGTPPE